MTSSCTAWCRRKREWLIRELGFFCSECGSGELLELDHIEPVRKGRGRGSFRRIREAIDNIDNIQLLCRPCHALKTVMERSMVR